MIESAPISPAIRYADSSGLKIAYQVFGDGPLDVVLTPGFISHIEYAWEEPLLARFLRQLSSFTRVIAFDKRGMGLSDRDPERLTPTLEQRCDDIEAVMNAAGSTSAALLAWSEGGATALSFCDSHLPRCLALVLVGTAARFKTAPGYTCGIPEDILRLFVDTMTAEWGTGVGFDLYAPSLSEDRRARAWWSTYQRLAATPGAVAASLEMHFDLDARPLLPKILVPTLVLHQRHDLVVPVECGRYLATSIPHARYVEQPGEDHMYWLGNQDNTLQAIRTFLSQLPQGAAINQLRPSRKRPSIGWESLTAAELDVVRLIAHGMTNPQIATRLYISARTVQTHVAHVMTKLGYVRRSEIAAEATRRGL
jgi:pimeloyl-ACP methyl ester carboxylesterase/DNA-binding CsgD family transcriptional regulator